MSQLSRTHTPAAKRLDWLRCGRKQVPGEGVTSIEALAGIEGLVDSQIRIIGKKALNPEIIPFDFDETRRRLTCAASTRDQRLIYRTGIFEIKEYQPYDCTIEASPDNSTGRELRMDIQALLKELEIEEEADPEHMPLPNLTIAKLSSYDAAVSCLFSIVKAMNKANLEQLEVPFQPLGVDNFREVLDQGRSTG